ncbi:twin-arginine translocase TatA/TatE family subunit [Paenibacillus ginsengarvi]|jgi:sec-independent protein translocase protein TatA|uniref:Sec-independent protein translocase protein TatA n=1 Tax=Paenibacillus ginsengarvi TaxID=400777 RepID=A0A3B0CL52_9BACL|nr:twin-arginine translocase TatA/TatE family subunit [Paenibacillus ginsengarvi]RKN86405.1 twin-arginine translocase TatA/TatE family subunit [Paenibacillus ginsengarvi]
MPFNIGWTGLILVILIALLLFGPSKLPQLGRAVGDTFREFRKGSRQMIAEAEETNAAEGKRETERKSIN